MHLFNEGLQDHLRQLRRRRAVRIAGTYVFVAWVAVQIADVLFPALFLPEWSVRLVLVVALIGLPCVLVIAWASGGERPALSPAGRRGAAVVTGLLATVVVAAAIRGLPGPASSEPTSIAVLPFSNLSRDQDQRYLGDGIAGELLDRLSRVEGLRLVSRTSSFAYRDSQADVRNIGRKLNVDAIVEGSIQRAGEQLRVTARLTDMRDGFTLWSESYTRTLDDLFAVQDDIARSVADALEVELLGSRHGAPGGEAYDLYLQGRHLFQQRTPASLAAASERFVEAIEKDPDFPLAYSGYADAEMLQAAYGNLEADTARRHAEVALEKALAMGPRIAEVNASLGLLKAFSGDVDGAEEAYRRAVELDPRYAMAHMWLGSTLHAQGRLGEALAAFRLADETTPGHPVIGVNLATVLFDMGQFDAGMVMLDELDTEHPRSGQIRRHAAMWMSEYGRLDDAVAAAYEAVEREPQSPLSHLVMAKAWLALEDHERASSWLATAREVGEDNMLVFGLEGELLLQQGRYGQLSGLAEERLARLAPGDARGAGARMYRTWAGISALLTHDYDRAVSLLESALSAGDIMHQTPEDLEAMTLLVFAYGKAARPADAARVLQRARAVLARAEGEGFASPAMAVYGAYVAAAAGEETATRAHVREAARRGWARRGVLLRHPALGAYRDRPWFRDLLARMSVRVSAQHARAVILAPSGGYPVGLAAARRVH